jgi:hypothetical protein
MSIDNDNGFYFNELEAGWLKWLVGAHLNQRANLIGLMRDAVKRAVPRSAGLPPAFFEQSIERAASEACVLIKNYASIAAFRLLLDGDPSWVASNPAGDWWIEEVRARRFVGDGVDGDGDPDREAGNFVYQAGEWESVSKGLGHEVSPNNGHYVERRRSGSLKDADLLDRITGLGVPIIGIRQRTGSATGSPHSYMAVRVPYLAGTRTWVGGDNDRTEPVIGYRYSMLDPFHDEWHGKPLSWKDEPEEQRRYGPGTPNYADIVYTYCADLVPAAVARWSRLLSGGAS